MSEHTIGGKTVKLTLPAGKAILGLVVAGLLLLGLMSSFYTVRTEEEAVVTRFGRYIKTEQPGLRFRLPFGIDQVKTLAVKRQLKQEFGFSTPGATNPYQSSSTEEQALEKEMVTGDLNSALVEWVIQYRITDPAAFEFQVRDPDTTLRHASESVMREVVGDRTVDEVITIGRQEIEIESQKLLQDLVKLYKHGHHDRPSAAQERESTPSRPGFVQ